MLEKINQPQDLKKLSLEELNLLADEIRDLLIYKITQTGGHMGSNLGMIEMTIALHYVFSSPIDKFVFDVSHQTYTHKILTGRKNAFLDSKFYGSISGYTTPKESKHDFFKVGHTSTSISLACGLAKARDLKKDHENIIAIIGDGALSGGEAFEGLNNIAMLQSNFILIVNDNEMSIANNQGGMYQNFQQLRKSQGTYPLNFFKTFNLDYLYLEEGNNIQKLIALFQKVKDIQHPIVLHIHTLKGKGLDWAIQDKEAGHWVNGLNQQINPIKETYESLTAKRLLQEMQTNKQCIAISPATPKAQGLTVEFRKEAKNQFIDVGIAEEHAVAFASGLAKNGATPVILANSSFLQRTYDQLNQDLAMNEMPVTILVFNGKINGGDCTHVGQYDMVIMSHIPNLVCLAPTYKEEYLALLDFALTQKKYPLVIRVPSSMMESNQSFTFDEQSIFKAKITHIGKQVAIMGLGNFYHLGLKLKEELATYGICATLINPLCYSHLDQNLLEELKKNHECIVTLEDGLKEGGWGYSIANYYATSSLKVLTYGGEKKFNDLKSLTEIYQQCRLTIPQMIEDILHVLKMKK